jgi:hypothetical protein
MAFSLKPREVKRENAKKIKKLQRDSKRAFRLLRAERGGLDLPSVHSGSTRLFVNAE